MGLVAKQHKETKKPLVGNKKQYVTPRDARAFLGRVDVALVAISRHVAGKLLIYVMEAAADFEAGKPCSCALR